MGNKKKMLIIDGIILIVAIIIDQLTKYLIEPLEKKDPIVIIDNVLELNYVENTGAAFGIMAGRRVLFLIIAVVVLAIFAWLLKVIPEDKKYNKLHIIFTFILAGAFGNTIDRIALGYVRDFIYFKLIDFPVFNVADIYITCSTPILIILILFFYKEEDLAFLNKKKRD